MTREQEMECALKAIFEVAFNGNKTSPFQYAADVTSAVAHAAKAIPLSIMKDLVRVLP
jgi:hypothetical protein